MRSKWLPQSNKDLRGFNSRQGIQVMSDIDPHWPNRRRIPQANADRVGVV
jgi:hypothetical protein